MPTRREFEPRKSKFQRTETHHPLTEELRCAYDPQSCGMGELAFALELSRTLPFEALPQWALGAISSRGSNYIQSAFISDWGFSLPNTSTSKLPILVHSRELFDKMSSRYNGLNWAVERDALEQLTGIPSTGDKTQPISDEELQEYLEEADKRGLVERLKKGEGKEILTLISELEPPIGERYSPLELRNRLIRVGVSFSGDLDKAEEAITISPTYQRKYLQAATYKLAIMLGYTEQLIHSAKALGKPIPPNFIPPTSPVYPTMWKEQFGEALPPFAELYARSLAIFKDLADPMDPNLVPFLALEPNFN